MSARHLLVINCGNAIALLGHLVSTCISRGILRSAERGCREAAWSSTRCMATIGTTFGRTTLAIREPSRPAWDWLSTVPMHCMYTHNVEYWQRNENVEETYRGYVRTRSISEPQSTRQEGLDYESSYHNTGGRFSLKGSSCESKHDI